MVHGYNWMVDNRGVIQHPGRLADFQLGEKRQVGDGRPIRNDEGAWSGFQEKGGANTGFVLENGESFRGDLERWDKGLWDTGDGAKKLRVGEREGCPILLIVKEAEMVKNKVRTHSGAHQLWE